MSEEWFSSPFTGLFTELGAVEVRAHDPDVFVWGGRVAAAVELHAGGSGWTEEAARIACAAEAVERLGASAVPADEAVEACFERWPLETPAVAPGRWVLFRREQYAQPGFPFEPFTENTVCRWVCFRSAADGSEAWVPEELAYLFSRPGDRHLIGPAISTGLACGRGSDPVLLRGLQETIERDAAIGAWWGAYPLEEHLPDGVFSALGPEAAHRVLRPNLTYRFYRIATPFSAHATVVTLSGVDLEGPCFSVGSACRETRRGSWEKSLLEAIQGRHYVRYLLARRGDAPGGRDSEQGRVGPPRTFAEHALYYTLHPSELSRTPLVRAHGRCGSPMSPYACDPAADARELLPELLARLGPGRPVLFRNMTAPFLARELRDWHALRVLVPGLQPLHGDHLLPFLGGPLGTAVSPALATSWSALPPHPFA